jgi:hypothetical protein
MDATAPGTRPFFKYASPDAARAILSTQRVLYSSPLTFNDPFDVQSGLHFDFDIDALPGKIIKALSEAAASVEAPPVDPSDVWGQLVLKLRQMYPTHGFPMERWARDTTDLFGWLAGKIKETQQGYQRHWREKLLPGVRVFCVSEERDNLLMWAHYARDHKGAVFEFWSLPEEDNPLSVARQIQYGAKPPPFFSEQDFLDDILSVRKLDFSSLYRRYVYCKSDHWRYEKEWRVWYPLADSAGLYDTMPVRASEFRALYLGCQMRAEDKDATLALVRNHFPSTRTYEASKSAGAYELVYTEV